MGVRESKAAAKLGSIYIQLTHHITAAIMNLDWPIDRAAARHSAVLERRDAGRRIRASGQASGVHRDLGHVDVRQRSGECDIKYGGRHFLDNCVNVLIIELVKENALYSCDDVS